jgi:hypothetical protein
MSETNSRFKDTAEVCTHSRTIRAAVEDLSNKAFPAFGPRVKCLHVCFTLTSLSKDERHAILEHRCKISAMDT